MKTGALRRNPGPNRQPWEMPISICPPAVSQSGSPDSGKPRIDSAAMGAFWNDPDADPPPGGERWSALVARVSAALDDMAARDTLVVTHGGAIRAALAALFGFDQRQLWAFDLPYAAMLTLRIWPGTPRTAQIVGLWT